MPTLQGLVSNNILTGITGEVVYGYSASGNKGIVNIDGINGNIKFSVYIHPNKGTVEIEGNRGIVIAKQKIDLTGEVGPVDIQGRKVDILVDGAVYLSGYNGPVDIEGKQGNVNIGIPVSLNGVAGTVDIKGLLGEMQFNLTDMVDYNDDVFLMIQDDNGKVKYYKGVVREKTPQDRMLSIKAILGDGILAERTIKENYSEQDIGLSVKQIIDTYCAPITTNNVNTYIDVIAPIKAKGKTPMSVLENLRRQYNIYYFVDNNWDMHFDTRDNITENNWDDEDNRSGYKVKLGDS